MTNNKTIAKFLAESNKIEGYDYPVADYEGCFKDRYQKRYNLLILDSEAAWSRISIGSIMVRGLQPIDVVSTHLAQMRMHSAIDKKDKGNFRTSSVTIKGANEAPHFVAIDNLISDFCDLFNEGKAHPLKLHYFFEYIHPFVDGNGRVGRLLYALYILKRKEKLKPFLDNYALERECHNEISKKKTLKGTIIFYIGKLGTTVHVQNLKKNTY